MPRGTGHGAWGGARGCGWAVGDISAVWGLTGWEGWGSLGGSASRADVEGKA